MFVTVMCLGDMAGERLCKIQSGHKKYHREPYEVTINTDQIAFIKQHIDYKLAQGQIVLLSMSTGKVFWITQTDYINKIWKPIMMSET